MNTADILPFLLRGFRVDACRVVSVRLELHPGLSRSPPEGVSRLLARLPQIVGDPFDLALPFQFPVAGGPAEHFSDPVGLVVEGGLPVAAVGTDQWKERNP
jgi:hypothetical protein